jgi:hypothetical protein
MSERRHLLHSLVCPLEPEVDSCAARLRLALHMMAAGIDMQRLNLQRAFPQESAEEISARLRRWAEEQPVAPGLRPRSLT